MVKRKWQIENKLLQGWRVHLPSEAEWEKAARGGKQILKSPFIASINDAVIEEDVKDLVDNPMPKRINPWDDNQDTNKANIKGSEIGSTSAVGCFSLGRSPYGCEDIVGNEWKWTRSIDKPYPYDPNDGREDLRKVTNMNWIRLRSNAYYSEENGVCFRLSNIPSDHDLFAGVSCRVVLCRVPITSFV